MTPEQMERAMEFLLNSQARLTADVQGLKETQAETSRQITAMVETQTAMVEAQTHTSRDVMTLAGVVSELSDTVSRLETQMEIERRENRERFAQMEIERQENRERFAQIELRMDRFEAQAESDREEIREAINKLIDVSGDTKSLAEKVTMLSVQTSQRVTDVDRRVTDLESKQP